MKAVNFEEVYLEELQKIYQRGGSREEANNVLLKLLSFLGYDNVVKSYKKIEN